MKKNFFFILIFIISSLAYGHKQHTHQYITREGYNLLYRSLALHYPQLKSNMGATDGGIYGTISGGAWLEDESDIVFGYENYDDFWEDGALKSITHFWNPDDGDIGQNYFRTTMFGIDKTIGSYPNAYVKMLKYRDGGWGLINLYAEKQIVPGFGAPNNEVRGILYSYTNLFVFFKTGEITPAAYFNSKLEIIKSEPTKTYLPKELRERVIWDILGRMCHLLQDMSVPAHVRRDMHPGIGGDPKDTYEEFYGNDFGFTGFSVYDQYGGFLNPLDKLNPIHYLMYTTAQMSDHFGSNGPYEGGGDNNLYGNPLQDEVAYLNTMNLATFGGNTAMKNPLVYDDVMAIRSKMMPQAIRATAGLLYWFAVNAGLTTSPITLAVSIGGTYQLYRDGIGRWYVTPQNSFPPYTYKWQYKLSGSVIEPNVENISIKSENSSEDIAFLPPPDTWLSVGTDSPNLSLPFNPNNIKDFYVRCKVSDRLGNSVTSGSLFVDVINSDPPPAESGSAELYESSIAAEERIPDSYSVFQNYPNPFNPSTVIRYDLPEAGNVSLRVYDILGREVAVLVNEQKEAGRYEAVFHAANLATGIYVYELRTNNFRSVKKMNFVK